MKRTIAIVAGGDTSEFHVSLRSAQGIYSFIDKEKYTLYIVEMQGTRWEVQLPDGAKAPVDRTYLYQSGGPGRRAGHWHHIQEYLSCAMPTH